METLTYLSVLQWVKAFTKRSTLTLDKYQELSKSFNTDGAKKKASVLLDADSHISITQVSFDQYGRYVIQLHITSVVDNKYTFTATKTFKLDKIIDHYIVILKKHKDTSVVTITDRQETAIVHYFNELNKYNNSTEENKKRPFIGKIEFFEPDELKAL